MQRQIGSSSFHFKSPSLAIIKYPLLHYFPVIMEVGPTTHPWLLELVRQLDVHEHGAGGLFLMAHNEAIRREYNYYIRLAFELW